MVLGVKAKYCVVARHIHADALSCLHVLVTYTVKITYSYIFKCLD